MTDKGGIGTEAPASIEKKREKPEDFVGWKSPDGKLEVVGIVGYQNTAALFKVTCTECSKDPELFPDGYFVSTKSNLRLFKPCGCGKNVRWFDWQYLILARRAAKGRFIVHGFAEEFHGKNTKIDLECLKDGYKWTASISSIINCGSGCPKCRDLTFAEKYKTPEQEALQKCIDICKEMDYDVVGFVDNYKNQRSKFEYVCKIHGKQNVRFSAFVNGGTRCPECAGNIKLTEQEALQKCIDICKEMNYDVIGFVDGYKNNKSARFEYNCKSHGKQSVSYDKFVNNGTRCRCCAKDENIRRLREDGNGNGYYPERKDEQDFLYVLDFNSKFIKVGRSFNVDKRMDSLKYKSKIKKIYKLRTFTATHQEIYDFEQELHNDLRERNFQHYVYWSTECFENDSLYILNKLLDKCGLEEVTL